MSTPSGFRAWCAIVGLNPFHVEQWADAERAAYARWALDQFRAKWKAHIAAGMPALIRERDGREALVNKVGADLRETMRPLVRNPWRHCPCHPKCAPHGVPSVHEAEDYPESLPRREQVLTWLRTEFGR